MLLLSLKFTYMDFGRQIRTIGFSTICKYFGVSLQHIDLCAKNLTQLYSKNLLVKSSENDFIFLPAFYLIMCLMKARKNFEKIAILKTQELVSF